MKALFVFVVAINQKLSVKRDQAVAGMYKITGLSEFL